MEVVEIVAGTLLLLAFEELVGTAAPLVHVGTLTGPVGTSLITSFALTQPDFAVSAAGHATCLNVTAGLSALLNQSNLQ